MLTLAIQDKDGVVNNLGAGVVETVYHGHQDTFGVFAFEGCLTLAIFPQASTEAKQEVWLAHLSHSALHNQLLTSPERTRKQGNGSQSVCLSMMIVLSLTCLLRYQLECWI